MVTDKIGSLKPAFHRVIGDANSDLHGFIVIDKFVSGRGTGGIRFTPTVTLDEVARLAREMTYKFAFLHLPSGGAKAGLVARSDISGDERERLFHRFGEALKDLVLDGTYIGGLDMGTNETDIRAFMAGAGHPARPNPGAGGISSNYFTALTVAVAAEGLLAARGTTLADASVLIEGVGKVGRHLLRLMDQASARVVGVSTLSGAIFNEHGLNVDDVLQANERFGDDFVRNYPGCESLASTDLFTQQGDLLIPGGGADSVNESNVDDVKARWVVPVANICASQEIEARLFRRGIDFVPGFVSNSGGVFCWYLGQLSETAREDIIRDRFKARIIRLVRDADRLDVSIPETARSQALENLAALQRIDDGRLSARLVALAEKVSPRRLGYVLGSRLFGQRIGLTSNLLVRSYYDARYFK
jgi:glutamate dehydrogenase (NAD(P)+)